MSEPRTIHDAIRSAQARLERAGLDPGDAAFDAEVLARFALGGWERGRLIVERRSPVPAGFLDTYEAALVRRERREPAAYIMGVREFWELEILVAPGVLVPRPETELIVEEALARVPVPNRGPLLVADVGTGSGCLAVALARWLPHAHVVATDVSDDALAVARRNLDRHGVSDRVTLVKADLLSDRIPNPESRIPVLFDLIVSNPPYVPTGDIPGLQPEVRDFEPRGALDGGADGLDVIRRLVPTAASRLSPGGLLIFEFGFGQADAIRAIVSSEGRVTLDTLRDDYAGIPRVAVLRRTGEDRPVPGPRSQVPV